MRKCGGGVCVCGGGISLGDILLGEEEDRDSECAHSDRMDTQHPKPAPLWEEGTEFHRPETSMPRRSRGLHRYW